MSILARGSLCGVSFAPRPRYASVVVVGKISGYEHFSLRSKFWDWRFKVLVTEVLVGPPTKSLTVIWSRSPLDLPNKVAEGPVLIGLREVDYPEPKSLTVLRALCSPPFILRSTSAEASAVRKILSEKPQ